MNNRNYWTALRQRRISRRTMLGASAKAGVGAAGLALVGCGDDDDDAAPAAVDTSAIDAAAGDASAAASAAGEASAAASEASAAASEAAAEEAADAAREAADAASAAGEEEEQAVAAGEVDLDAELIIGYRSLPPTLDVTTAAGGGGNAASNVNHFSSLFPHSREGGINAWEPEGGFASYEFVDNNTGFVIELQPGITFHNGEPLDAEHLAWYYDRVLTLEGGCCAARIAWMGERTIVDDLTVRIVMDPPWLSAPEASGGPQFSMTPRDYIEDNGEEHFSTNPVGTGAYQFVSWIPDQEIRSTQFKDYFFPRNKTELLHPASGGQGWVKDLTGRFFPEEQARVAALEAGEIDVAHRINADAARRLEDDEDFKVVTLADTRVMAIELPVNQSLDPITGGPNPWRDKRVRQAANYAIDAASIVENLLTGKEEPRAYSPFPAGYPLPLGDLDAPYDYDPDRARALLEEAGQVGFAFTITVPTGLWTGDKIWMPAVQQMLNEVGFQVEVDFAEFGPALAAMRDRQVPNPFIFNQGSTTAGAGSGVPYAWTNISTVEAVFSHAKPDDDFLPEFEEFQALVDEANAEFDTERRNDLLFEAAEIHYSQAFHISLFNLSHQHGTRSNIVYDNFFANTYSLFESRIQVLKT